MNEHVRSYSHVFMNMSSSMFLQMQVHPYSQENEFFHVLKNTIITFLYPQEHDKKYFDV